MLLADVIKFFHEESQRLQSGVPIEAVESMFEKALEAKEFSLVQVLKKWGNTILIDQGWGNCYHHAIKLWRSIPQYEKELVSSEVALPLPKFTIQMAFGDPDEHVVLLIWFESSKDFTFFADPSRKLIVPIPSVRLMVQTRFSIDKVLQIHLDGQAKSLFCGKLKANLKVGPDATGIIEVKRTNYSWKLTDGWASFDEAALLEKAALTISDKAIVKSSPKKDQTPPTVDPPHLYACWCSKKYSQEYQVYKYAWTQEEEKIDKLQKELESKKAKQMEELKELRETLGIRKDDKLSTRPDGNK